MEFTHSQSAGLEHLLSYLADVGFTSSSMEDRERAMWIYHYASYGVITIDDAKVLFANKEWGPGKSPSLFL